MSWCGDEKTHPKHWFRGFNGVDHNTTDIECNGWTAQCCCRWGAAVGKRYGIPSDEWPEFGCYQCPVHQHGAGEQPDELCYRHRREAVGAL